MFGTIAHDVLARCASHRRWLLALYCLTAICVLSLFFPKGGAQNERPVVLYAFHDTPDARANMLFFLQFGLHNKADFVFILQGASDITKVIPTRPNIQVVQRDNSCYDMGAYGEVLGANGQALIRRYKRFILINASIRGPFVPHWASNACWSDLYLSKLSPTVRLVGMSYDCHNWYNEQDGHLQSMIFATDRVGMKALMSPRCLSSCYSEMEAAVNGEIEATHLIREAGFEVVAMNSVFHSREDYGETCSDNNPTLHYFGGYMHPYETMFFKTKTIDRGVDTMSPSFLDAFTRWQVGANYTSYASCG